MKIAISSGPSSGPMSPTRPYRHDLEKRFDGLMKALNWWRNEDHEDALSLCRSDVIEIIEGVKELRRCAHEDSHQ